MKGRIRVICRKESPGCWEPGGETRVRQSGADSNIHEEDPG
ncbi:hypothetical protein [Dehalobacter sp. DCM]